MTLEGRRLLQKTSSGALPLSQAIRFSFNAEVRRRDGLAASSKLILENDFIEGG
ncbi:MAG TPA: hypothetical protein VMV10_10815 [Pirellulales bacterium]|nr:hypothetical protein [Pirellulales bacterium]